MGALDALDMCDDALVGWPGTTTLEAGSTGYLAGSLDKMGNPHLRGNHLHGAAAPEKFPPFEKASGLLLAFPPFSSFLFFPSSHDRLCFGHSAHPFTYNCGGGFSLLVIPSTVTLILLPLSSQTVVAVVAETAKS